MVTWLKNEVVRLDVSMTHTLGVDIGHCSDSLDENSHKLVVGKWLLIHVVVEDLLVEVTLPGELDLIAQQLGWVVVLIEHFVNGTNVLMLELRDGVDLLEYEVSNFANVRVLEDLDKDYFTIVVFVSGQLDASLTTTGNCTHDLKLTISV